MDSLYKAIFSRNMGILTETEQDKLQKSTVAVAGAGGVGGLLVERLIRLGVGRLKISDPGRFEETDLNRQFGSCMQNLGEHKVEVVLAQIKDINPQAHIYCSTTGSITINPTAKGDCSSLPIRYAFFCMYILRYITISSRSS